MNIEEILNPYTAIVFSNKTYVNTSDTSYLLINDDKNSEKKNVWKMKWGKGRECEIEKRILRQMIEQLFRSYT